MNWLFPLISFIAGAILATGFNWLLAKYRQQQALDCVRLKLQAESNALKERFAAKEQEASDKSTRLNTLENETRKLQDALQLLHTQKATLETTVTKEKEAAQEKLKTIENAQANLTQAFKALSAEALKSNNQSFVELAQSTFERFHQAARGELEKRQEAIGHLVKPITQSLQTFDSKVGELEKARIGAYEGLNRQVRDLIETQNQLRSETTNLVKALGTPRVRGRWGEIQLKRVVEMAGMLEYCDFKTQQSVTTDEGRFRPDMIVRLPGGKQIVVDSKTPLEAYLEAIEAVDDTTQAEKLKAHARQVKDHIKALSQKSYWDQFQPAPEFVVMFLPGECFYNAALQQDPSLIEYGANERVIPATPTTLIPLLKAIAYGWRQEALAENAREISDLGKELYKRIGDLGVNFADLGTRLQRTVESYNKAVGSIESRVLVSARRFHELKASGTHKEIEVVAPIATTPRQMQIPEVTRQTDLTSGQ